METRILSYWLIAWAIVTPVSIAGTSLIYFPLLTLYIVLAAWTFRRWPPSWGPVEKVFLIFWGLSVLSAFLGGDPGHSMKRLSKDLYITILIVLNAYFAREESRSRLLKVYMLAAIGTAVFGVLQFLIGANQTDSSHGIFLHLPHWLAQAPRPILNTLSMVNGRVTGPRSHPLTYAEGLLFPLGYTLSILTTYHKNWWKWAFAQYLVLLALVFSQSRGPWLAAVVMVLILCLIRRDLQLYRRLALIFVPVVLCFLAPGLRKRAFSITDTSYASNSERLEMWRVGRAMVHDHPFFGIGTGMMNVISPQYQSPTRRRDGPWGHLHNMYVNIAAERGLLAFVAFLFFIAMLGWELWLGYRVATKKNDDSSQLILLTALLSLAGWLVAGFTETVFHDSTVLMMFYFVMGIAIATSRRLVRTSTSAAVSR